MKCFLIQRPRHSALVLVLQVPALVAANLAQAAPPAGSPYYTDAQTSYVQDQTGAGIAAINMITCLTGAVRPDALVNEGPYVALVDQNRCSNQSLSVSSAVDAAAGVAPNYQSVRVNATRTSDAAPQRVELWVDGGGDNLIARTWVNLSVAAAPSASAPFGDYRLDYCQTASAGGTCASQGYLVGGAASLNFFQTQNGTGTGLTRALTLSAPSTSAGTGAMSLSEAGNTTNYSFAYDANLYRRSDGSHDECFSRDASDPATGFSAWSYALYDASTGVPVQLNTGIPVSFEAGGSTYNTYVGYWGISAPAGAAGLVTNGMTVQGIAYDHAQGSATKTNYTLELLPGRLTLSTRQTATLRDLDQIRFDVWVHDASALYPGAPDNSYFEAYWDDTTSLFYVTGIISCGSAGCATQRLADPQAVSPSFWLAAGGVQAWAQSFGGDLYIDLQGATLPVQSTTVAVAYRSQSLVRPDQMPAALYCVNDCPTAATLAAYFAAGSTDTSPYGTTFNNFEPTATGGVVSYSLPSATGLLTDASGSPVVFTDAADLAAHPQYANGVSSGRLFTQLSDALCNPQADGIYCDYKASNLPDYYVWQTGAQPWNQFAGIRGSDGTYVSFAPPLTVSFAVPNSSTYGAYAGTSVVLQYGGYGQLYGFPTGCVDPVTNLATDCGAGGSRTVPAFMIPTDTAVGLVTAGTTPYLVKWLTREIRLAVKDPSQCEAAGLSLPSGLALPDASALQNPASPAASIYIGTAPVVVAPPRVIQGVVEY